MFVRARIEHALTQASWHGHLALTFQARGGASRLTRSEARLPLAVQRPFYPEGPAVCHTVILHPPGGMVGGDRLDMRIRVDAGAHALLTTTAAGKLYRSAGSEAQQLVRATVAEDACLEWLPQESIVFNGAICRQELRVDLSAGAAFLGWDITRFGRTAQGERFESGMWRNRLEVWRDGQPLWIDRQALAGGSTLLKHPHGLAGKAVAGVLVWIGTPVPADLVTAARECWKAYKGEGEAGVTRLQDGLLCRYRGSSSAEARLWFMAIWDLLRRHFLNRPACPPRIWNA